MAAVSLECCGNNPHNPYCYVSQLYRERDALKSLASKMLVSLRSVIAAEETDFVQDEKHIVDAKAVVEMAEVMGIEG